MAVPSDPPRHATPRQRDLQDRLIAAAERAIESGGLGTIKARGLAETAGCSVGAIYGVFADLDALVLAVNGRTLDAVAAALAAVPSRGAPAEYLVQLAEAYLAYAASNGPRWRAVFGHRMAEGRAVPPGYAERQAAAFAFIEAPLGALLPDLSRAQAHGAGADAVCRGAWDGGARAGREGGQPEAGGAARAGADRGGGDRNGAGGAEELGGARCTPPPGPLPPGEGEMRGQAASALASMRPAAA